MWLHQTKQISCAKHKSKIGLHFLKIGVKCAIAQFPLSPEPSQTRKLLENEFITKKSLEKLNLSINLPVIKVVSYLWRHWLTKEKQEFMFTLHIPVRPHSIMRETSCYTRLWYLEIDRAALYQTTTNYDVMDYKQCSLFRDTITTDCPVSVHVIPCCFLLYFVIKLFIYYTSFGLFLVYEDFFFWAEGMPNGIFCLMKRFIVMIRLI